MMRKALFQLPAVRFRVIDQDNPKGRLLAPWDHPEDTDLARRARLQAFGTVARPPRENQRSGSSASGPRWFRTGTMDGYQFLAEILSGRRAWYPPGQLDHPTGLWALDTDVARYRAFRSQQREVVTPTFRSASASLPMQRPSLPTRPSLRHHRQRLAQCSGSLLSSRR